MMQQVKIFKSIESELWNMEAEINAWMKEENVKVLNITGNIAPQTGAASSTTGSFSASDVLIVVLYEK